MRYAIIGTDTPLSSAARHPARPRHLERVQPLVQQGRLVVPGPFPAPDAADPGPNGGSASLIVAAFAGPDAARAWTLAERYATGGVCGRIGVSPFRPVLP